MRAPGRSSSRCPRGIRPTTLCRAEARPTIPDAKRTLLLHWLKHLFASPVTGCDARRVRREPLVDDLMVMNSPPTATGRPPSTAGKAGVSKKVFEGLEIPSSFCAGFAEERREPVGWRPGANGFGDFCRNKSHSGVRRRAHRNSSIAKRYETEGQAKD